MAFHKKNIILTNTYEEHSYTSDSTVITKNYKPRIRQEHGEYLLKQLNQVWADEDQRKAMFASIRERQGTYIEVKGAENCDLLFKSLENAKQGIEFLNLRNENVEEGVVQSATVFIPEGKENYFNDRVQKYLHEETKGGNIRYKELVESIETIQLAVLSSFWIGDPKDIPDEVESWCEFWLSTAAGNEIAEANEFYQLCDQYQIVHDDKYIVFPEKVIVLLKVNKDKIQQLINISGKIAEIRRAPETAGFYTKMNSGEAKEWIDDLKDRITQSSPESYICILDTGVNKGHPLLENVLADNMIQSANKAWKTNDHEGHGTEMAGICEYFELEPLLTKNENIILNHHLESVKILPDDGKSTDPKLYGAITSDAASIAGIANPSVKRVYCMAVTADKYTTKDGSPSSWSAELDKIISGVEDGIKKIFVVSAGNVQTNEIEEAGYTDANINHPIEDPGQSWNAITVGAYTDKIEVNDTGFSGWSPVADVSELSPFSSTSVTWDSKWPIKPEILLEGGNAITDGRNVDICDDLSLLTTHRNFLIRPFSTINATSAATAQAANMAARLMETNPTLWEETIRGLMVHSAEWTEKMKKQFCTDGKKTVGRRNLLRACGYGVASFERAVDSLNNSVNMIIQAEIQPYCKDGSSYKTKDMHLHKIPWPKDLLVSLENMEVRMKVTLSYYIEPAPEQKGWNNKYRYSSGALRFEVINKNQTKEDFLKRVNAAARGNDKKDKGDGNAGSDRWFLGKDNRDVGSIHSDTWTGAAIDLAESDYIAVYPVIGWWRERHNLGKFNEKMRYALIVTISTPSEKIDFYTPIETIIEAQIRTPIENKI